MLDTEAIPGAGDSLHGANMTLALSTRWLGVSPFSVERLLEVLRTTNLRACALAPGSPGPTPDELERALRPAGVRVVAIEPGFASRGDDPARARRHGFLAARSDERAAAFASARAAAHAGRAVGARHVVLRLGEVDLDGVQEREAKVWAAVREAGYSENARSHAAALAADVDRRAERLLDDFCRALFELCRTEPEARFAIATPEGPAGFPTLRVLPQLLDELHEPNLGYWHDVGHAARLERLGLAPAGAWLGEHGARTFGASVHDVAGADLHVPPGAGEVDFVPVRDGLPSGVPRVLEIDSRFPLTEVRLAGSFVRDALGT